MKGASFSKACIIAACIVGLSPRAWAEDAEANVKIGDREGKASIRTDSADKEHRTVSEHATSTKVTDVYKASGLIGMEVKNRRNETLGQIKDVVIDLESGRVSYVVLSTGGFLGVGDKMVAVPPNAFEIAETQNQVVLNADRESLRNAQGLARNDWPDVQNPSWGAQAFWDKPDAGGASARAEVGTGSSDRSESRLSEDAEVNSSRKSDHEDHVFRGEIESINPEERTFTVRGKDGTRSFKLDDKPILVIGDNRNPRLVDFQVGYSVVVGYGKNGEDTAHRLQRTDVGAGQFK